MDYLKQSILRQSAILYHSKDDVEYAKIVARRMFELYDKDKNRNIDNYEVSPMIEDAYKSFNKTYNPTNDDVNCFAKILDVNHDGKVSLSDLEALCIKYLVGEHALLQNNSPSVYKSSEETAKKSRSPPYYESSPVLNRSSTRIYDYSGSPYRRAESRVDHSGSPYKRAESRVQEYGYESPIKHAETEKRAVHGHYSISTLLKNSYANHQSGKIGQIRRVFDKYDTNKDGVIDEFELKHLMEETYRFLGLTSKVVTSTDVQSYLDMVDSNKDGKISYLEYEAIVVKCLAKYNIKFD